MKEYKCPNCGASVNPDTGICEYCGSRFEIEKNQLLKIETYTNPVKVYQTKMEVPEEALLQPSIEQILVDQLARNLADAIKPNMEIKTDYDPMRMTQWISARVRIVEPKYMF